MKRLLIVLMFFFGFMAFAVDSEKTKTDNDQDYCKVEFYNSHVAVISQDLIVNEGCLSSICNNVGHLTSQDKYIQINKVDKNTLFEPGRLRTLYARMDIFHMQRDSERVIPIPKAS